MEEEEEEKRSENEKLYDAVERGDEELVKVLLHSKQLNSDFEHKVFKNCFFFFLLLSSFVFLLLSSFSFCFFEVDFSLHSFVFLFCDLFLWVIITSSFVQEESQTWREKVEQTALHNAASKGFEQIVKILIEHGSNVDLQNQVLIFFFLLFIFSCDGEGERERWLCVCYLFFFKTSFYLVWMDPSSRSCLQREKRSCENPS